MIPVWRMAIRKLGTWGLWFLKSFECQHIAIGIFNQTISQLVAPYARLGPPMKMTHSPKYVIDFILAGSVPFEQVLEPEGAASEMSNVVGERVWPLIPQ
jgi:hypothetical protein